MVEDKDAAPVAKGKPEEPTAEQKRRDLLVNAMRFYLKDKRKKKAPPLVHDKMAEALAKYISGGRKVALSFARKRRCSMKVSPGLGIQSFRPRERPRLVDQSE